MSSQVPPEVSEPIAAAARDAGVDVYHAELGGRTLRVQVESAANSSVRACSDFSRALAIRLDAAGFLHGQYELEVSTPGVERSLYQPDDYVKALNREVRVRAGDGVYLGRLVAAGPTGITVKLQAPNPKPQTPDLGVTREFAYAEVREARISVSDSELFARVPAERNK
jgi:ribosome maturation factor RimP